MRFWIFHVSRFSENAKLSVRIALSPSAASVGEHSVANIRENPLPLGRRTHALKSVRISRTVEQPSHPRRAVRCGVGSFSSESTLEGTRLGTMASARAASLLADALRAVSMDAVLDEPPSDAPTTDSRSDWSDAELRESDSHGNGAPPSAAQGMGRPWAHIARARRSRREARARGASMRYQGNDAETRDGAGSDGAGVFLSDLGAYPRRCTSLRALTPWTALASRRAAARARGADPPRARQGSLRAVHAEELRERHAGGLVRGWRSPRRLPRERSPVRIRGRPIGRQFRRRGAPRGRGMARRRRARRRDARRAGDAAERRLREFSPPGRHRQSRHQARRAARAGAREPSIARLASRAPRRHRQVLVRGLRVVPRRVPVARALRMRRRRQRGAGEGQGRRAGAGPRRARPRGAARAGRRDGDRAPQDPLRGRRRRACARRRRRRRRRREARPRVFSLDVSWGLKLACAAAEGVAEACETRGRGFPFARLAMRKANVRCPGAARLALAIRRAADRRGRFDRALAYARARGSRGARTATGTRSRTRTRCSPWTTNKAPRTSKNARAAARSISSPQTARRRSRGGRRAGCAGWISGRT